MPGHYALVAFGGRHLCKGQVIVVYMEVILENIREIMEAAVSEYGANKAFTLKLGDGEYRDISYGRYYEEIRCLGEALLCRGFSNTRIVIIGKNSYNWYLANMATLLTGNITVPLDKELKYDEFESSLIRSEAEVIFYDEKEAESVAKAIASGGTIPPAITAAINAPLFVSVNTPIEKA